jgi:hypothetical protein
MTRLAGAPVADTPWSPLREIKVFISLAGSSHQCTVQRAPDVHLCSATGLRLFPQHAQSSTSQRMGYIPGSQCLPLQSLAANGLAKGSSHFDAIMYSSAYAGRGVPACAFTAGRTAHPGCGSQQMAHPEQQRARASMSASLELQEESRVTRLRSGSSLLPTRPQRSAYQGARARAEMNNFYSVRDAAWGSAETRDLVCARGVLA